MAGEGEGRIGAVGVAFASGEGHQGSSGGLVGGGSCGKRRRREWVLVAWSERKKGRGERRASMGAVPF
jgi:hypothetical protein